MRSLAETTPRQRADAIRFLSMDAIDAANSGHPGMPLGMADIAEVLWHNYLQHNPLNPQWPNRDRFVLSNGHGAMLLYALLHLSGYDLTIDDLRKFRQLHSRTPGHPEFGITPGVETTTGPLGQGLANAVGMALAEKHLAAEFNRAHYAIVDHYTYCFVGDGCLMEGISHEVCSLAGVLRLNKLIVFYDDNGISIDGEVQGWFADNTPLRFKSYGWHVIEAVDGHNSAALHAAIQEAHRIADRPILICCKTTIGWGAATLAGSAKTHGAALGATEIAATRAQLNWQHEAFVIPDDIYAVWDAQEKGAAAEAKWQQLFDAYAQQYPELAQEFVRRKAQGLPADFSYHAENLLTELQAKKSAVATRKASQWCLERFAVLFPELMGGSADLTESNCTNWQNMQVFSAATPAGRYIHYGVREFGMSAIMNGLALYRGIIPFGGTFLTFSDYARNAVRLAALMEQRVIFIYTHDSIGLGEDGPTHQPIEHIPSLRLIPGLSVWRPADAVETAAAWASALTHNGPTCLLLSRQSLPHQERTLEQIHAIRWGGYILYESSAQVDLDVILIATGSELSLVMQAAAILTQENIQTRVISLPSLDVFLAQPLAYRTALLPPAIRARVAIEAAATSAWYQLVGSSGVVVGIDRFGASAPADAVYTDCGLTINAILRAAKASIQSVAKQMMVE